MNDPGARRVTVADIIIHPGFFLAQEGSDIALLQLAEPLTTPTLPLIEKPLLANPGTMATILGWGQTDPEDLTSFPTRLQVASVPIVSQAVAQEVWGNYGLAITEAMLPAGFASGGIDTCQGDSGGPLVVPDGEGGWRLAGITSFGEVICALPESYTIYTRISAFRSWILSHIMPNYAEWEATQGVNGFDQDADGDGLSHFAEYALGSDPNSPSNLQNLQAVALDLVGEPHLGVQFPRRRETEEVRYRLQVSDNLQNWQEVPIEENTTAIETLNAEMELVTIADISSPSAGTGRFMRLLLENGNARTTIALSIGPSQIANQQLTPSIGGDPDRPGLFYSRDFNLEAPAGEALTAVLRSLDFNAYLSLINTASGQVLSSNDDGAGNLDARLSFTPAENTSHTLRVSSAEEEETGRFTLRTYPSTAGLPSINVNAGLPGNLSPIDDLPDPLSFRLHIVYSL